MQRIVIRLSTFDSWSVLGGSNSSTDRNGVLLQGQYMQVCKKQAAKRMRLLTLAKGVKGPGTSYVIVSLTVHAFGPFL